MSFLTAFLWLPALASIASAQPWSRSGVGDVARYLHHRASDGIILDKSTQMDSSLQDFILFKYTAEASTKKGNAEATSSTDIAIICTKCYVLGSTHVKLTSHGRFNATQLTQSAVDAFNNTFSEVKNYTNSLADDVARFLNNSIDAVTHLNFGSLQGFDLPVPQIDFNVDVAAAVDPDMKLSIEFQDLDVYAELGIVLSSGLTYTLNLYSSTELGVEVGSVLVGAVVKLDLILSTETEVDLSAGFHMKMDRALLDITMFADEASQIDFHGGKFEFLPVTVETSSVILKAVLRLGVRTGFSGGIDYSKPVEILNQTLSDLQLKSGIEASVFVNLAEFTTNVTRAKPSDSLPDKCDTSVEQGYRFVIGAAAGASVQLFDHIWGPVPKTEIPIFYTSLKGACIDHHTASVSTSPAATLKGRADVSTTTTKTTYTYSALACASQLVNCPASLMTLSTNIVKTTLSTTVPSGAAVVWTAQQTGTAQAAPVKFGTNAVTMASSSGKPAQYVPTSNPSSTSQPNGGIAGLINGPSGANNKLIIGLSVGLGLPALIAIISTAIFCYRRNKYTRSKGQQPVEQISEVK